MPATPDGASTSPTFTNVYASPRGWPGWPMPGEVSRSRTRRLIASRLAARRGLSIVQDVVSIDGNNLTSPIYSGKANQTVTVSGDAVVSVRANVFPAVGSESSNEVSVVDASGDVKTAVQEVMQRASARLDVSEANIIISGGRGMGSPANFSHLEAVADTIGAAVGASRAAVDTWEEIPHSIQAP